MKQIRNSLQLSATDLVGYLNCRHLSALDLAVTQGTRPKPKVWDPLLQILWERGSRHEQQYVDHLAAAGLEVIRIDGIEVTDEAVAETLEAMRRGASVIVQGALASDRWAGRADILKRVETASSLGSWSYQAVDTKLARETKAGAVLQLCLYSELIEQAQGRPPEFMHIIPPWSEFEPQSCRYTDYAAYFRSVQRSMLDDITTGSPPETYPDPTEHCDICRWREACDKQRHDDDHLCLVAGISKVQINELQQRGITTLSGLAAMPFPLDWRPDRGSVETYNRIREQARVQAEAREAGEAKIETLPVEPGFGLTRLPEPSSGDVFLDLEGDPFVGEHGLEYLFGALYAAPDGQPVHRHAWAFSRPDERQAFEDLIDFTMARWENDPNMHIYHYAPYEPSALKRLAGRYATREEELDRMLRAGLFVDLYQVIRHSIRASVESYSIKRLEPFYEFEREIALSDVNSALALLHASLELDDIPSMSEETRSKVLAYNRDDCASVSSLRDWLEGLRAQRIKAGEDVPRPEPGDGSPNEKITAWLARINPLIERLTADVPVDPDERNDEQQARWILANILDWHRREDKATWWEFFRLADLPPEDLFDERSGLSGLTFVGEAGGTAAAPIHRYRFPAQETELRGGEDLCNVGGDKFGKVDAIALEDRTVDIKKRKDTAHLHPEAVFAHTYVSAEIMAEALFRLCEHVAEHGLLGDGPYQAARDLLLRAAPRVEEQALQQDGEAPLDAAVRLCNHLTGGILPIQGPPGAGKTFTGARMICELVRQGKTVGITANSHKVIRNLIDATIKAADEHGVDLHCCHRAKEKEEPQHRLSFARNNADLLGSLGNGTHVGGGTAWLWSCPEASEAVDVLFVDEAAQMSLANVLAVSQAAKAVVLIGDPQQLDQPTQGCHPDGTGVSALDHILAREDTIPRNRGLFLEQTWRLHPGICAFTSELFYAGQLRSRDGLERQEVVSTTPIIRSGLYYLPVEHDGNQNCSPEEAQAVSDLVNTILQNRTSWSDREGNVAEITLDDILIITPYNAQVFEIKQRLPRARVGTVDKFQGQDAAIAIYSTATSSHADAPRGMEFLYSLNRLNVATSRAKCASIMISSPRIFEAECRTPRQIQLANAFCRYLEMAERLTL